MSDLGKNYPRLYLQVVAIWKQARLFFQYLVSYRYLAVSCSVVPIVSTLRFSELQSFYS